MKNKNLLLFILFLSLPFIGYTQHYEHTLNANKRWHISQDMGMGVQAHYYYATTCDTSINSANYFRLDQVYPLAPSHPTKLIGFVREDTTAQKVYFLDTNSINEELIIDYTLSIGDSFNFINWSSRIPVVHIDSAVIGGVLRKVIHFKGYGQGGPYPRFIEGMGNGFWGVNRNFNSNGIEHLNSVSNQTTFTCSSIMPIQNILASAENIQVFPNPFKESIHLVLEHDQNLFLKGFIYDYTGRPVQSFEIKNEIDLSLDSLAPGIYALQIAGFQAIKIIKNK